MKKWSLYLFSFVLLATVRPAWSEGTDLPIGNIDQIQGEVGLMRKGEAITPAGNTLLQEGDRLTTGKGGLKLRLRDNSRITLAANTQFEITRYRFNAEAKTSDAHFKLLSGALRAVTGAIGHLPKPSFEVETPVATMGIRGTDFWGGFIFNGDLDVAMFSGKGVYVRNADGISEIRLPGEGVTVVKGRAPTDARIWPDWKIQRAIESTLLEP